MGKKTNTKQDKKYYAVGCYTADDWQYIHEVLMQDGTLEDNIPSNSIQCSDLKKHSETRAVYLLSDSEAKELRNHPKIKYVMYDADHYPEQYAPIELHKDLRYNNKGKQYKQFDGLGYLPATPNATDINRSGYQLLRCTQKENPWKNQSTVAIHNDRIEHHGTGKGVDLIIVDNGVWTGHSEFNNNTGNNPRDHVGGNALSGVGSCSVLDLVLDSPYYIDPAWFNANPGTRLTTRWDGTTVPVESVARDWWSDGTQRSESFLGVGTVTVSSDYTRANHCGTNAAIPANASNADHGTPCAANAYGRTQGWAYNANKWSLVINISINDVGITSGIGIEQSFDMVKIFHENKPNNSTYGTKNPTISSNSWGTNVSYSTTSYYDAQVGTAFTGFATYQFEGAAQVKFENNTAPNFTRLFNYTTGAGSTGGLHYPIAEGFAAGFIDAANEMINAGVIFINSAGNNAQKIVRFGHVDYNNTIRGFRYTTTPGNDASTTLENIFFLNRPAWPAQAGQYTSGGQQIFPAIIVGALDDANNANGREQKVNYSSRGNAVDFYVPADGTLSAGTQNANIPRPDTYTGLIVAANDLSFTGTSSACPVAAGLIATKLEYNRSWGWLDVKNWINGFSQPVGVTTVGFQTPADFYFGLESSTENDGNWLDYNSLEGGNPIVLWDAPTGRETKSIGLTL